MCLASFVSSSVRPFITSCVSWKDMVVGCGAHWMLARIFLSYRQMGSRTALSFANNVVAFVFQSMISGRGLAHFSGVLPDDGQLFAYTNSYFLYDLIMMAFRFPEKKPVYWIHHMLSMGMILSQQRWKIVPHMYGVALILLLECTTPLLTLKDILYKAGWSHTGVYRKVYQCLLVLYAFLRVGLLGCLIVKYMREEWKGALPESMLVIGASGLCAGSALWWKGLWQQYNKK